jgi:hypothetical protein
VRRYNRRGQVARAGEMDTRGKDNGDWSVVTIKEELLVVENEDEQQKNTCK